ncbi:alpha/beta hydrolase family protein [Arthrobacter sp. B3I4]|uniref:alpha/beta hydrolase n=1 Tax=Arthrobacter sp. B3I4 TaxID=3042267 RepID=UPI0027829120|nr:alpha/beta hydrolase-fold protein [Arthrobacter sp. B3I4]MDQ0756056.1 pimeloyl-ACP methyl ester carboxylesterase [Arthrobacter sp. B3I4]
MDEPQLDRRRMLELGAGLLGAATLAACSPPAGRQDGVGGPSEGATGGSGPVAQPSTSTPAAPGTPAPRVVVRTDSFVSRFRPNTDTEWSLAIPVVAGYERDKMPVALFLHGTGSDNRFLFDNLGIEAVLQRYLADGGTPFAVASVDGGDTWWHRRTDGTDTGSMLIDEFVPLLASQGLDLGRFGLFGLSMGGFGVLLLASQGKIPGLRAVAAMSPAVFSDYDDSLEDAFDSPEDFAANDVFALRPKLAPLPKRIDCGTEDSLLPYVKDYVAGLPGHVEGGFQPGGHEEAYWRLILPAVLSFLGRQLA